MKKTVSVILTVLLLLGTFGFALTAAAAGNVIARGNCGGEGDGKNLAWTLYTDGTLTIVGEGAMADYTPYYNYGSDAPPWRTYESKLKKVILEEGVSCIGNYAFYSCGLMESIALPAGLTRIGEQAFHECSSLTEVTIPYGVTSIERHTFSYCTSLV